MQKCGGMICINLIDFNQKASETTYANDHRVPVKENLCFKCATGIKLGGYKTKPRKKKCK